MLPRICKPSRRDGKAASTRLAGISDSLAEGFADVPPQPDMTSVTATKARDKPVLRGTVLRERSENRVGVVDTAAPEAAADRLEPRPQLRVRR